MSTLFVLCLILILKCDGSEILSGYGTFPLTVSDAKEYCEFSGDQLAIYSNDNEDQIKEICKEVSSNEQVCDTITQICIDK